MFERWPAGLVGLTSNVAVWARSHLPLWIVFASAVDAAAVVLVSVLIALPSQAGITVSVLITILLILLVLSIVLPVAGKVIGEREQASHADQQSRERDAQRNRHRQERMARLLVAGSPVGFQSYRNFRMMS